jgi:hypothetical protein
MSAGREDLWRRLINAPGGAARMSLLIKRRLGIDHSPVTLAELADSRARFGLLPGTEIARLLSFAAGSVMADVWCQLVHKNDRDSARQRLGDDVWEFVTQRARLTVGPIGQRYAAAIHWTFKEGDLESSIVQHEQLKSTILESLLADRSAGYRTLVKLKLPEYFPLDKTSQHLVARDEAWTLARRLIQQEWDDRWQACFA